MVQAECRDSQFLGWKRMRYAPVNDTVADIRFYKTDATDMVQVTGMAVAAYVFLALCIDRSLIPKYLHILTSKH